MVTADGHGVIWDMDGTLVDTAELHFAAWVALAGDLGKPFTRDDFTATFGRRNPEIIRKVFDPNASDADVAQLGDRKEDLYKAQARKGVDLLPGVRRLLEDLHAAGFKQAIGSSAPRGNLDLIFELTHIAPYLDAIVSMEDTQRGKPDPQVFLVAAAKMGVAPARCLVIEDAMAGVEAAKAGGMKAIGVTFVGHHPAERLRAAGADLVVPTLEAVTVETVRQLLGVVTSDRRG
jgi:beta-phosphoglucomutase